MKDKILEAVQISKTYGEGESAVHALRNSDLTLENGTFASIIGSSGSGKSTLLKILGGLLPPTTGKVLLDGQDIYAMNAEAKDRLYFSGFPPVPGVHGAG
mgnify:CR=1 FL=1